MTTPKFLAPLAGALALLGAFAGGAHAGSTDPVLVIGHATASGGSPARVLDLLGSWGFEDVMQIDYPLNIVVRQGSTFVRYPVGGTPVSGTFAGLADGLSAAEIPALEAAGSTASSASIARLALHEMTLALPPVFAAGDVEVLVYVELPVEGTFLSNTATSVGAGS